VRLGEQVVEQGGLAGAQEAGEDLRKKEQGWKMRGLRGNGATALAPWLFVSLSLASSPSSHRHRNAVVLHLDVDHLARAAR
jgi:hypothetical protein